MIHVEERSLRPFEQHGLPALERLPHDTTRIDGERQEPRRQPLEEVDVLLGAGSFATSTRALQELEHLVRRFHTRAHEILGPNEIAQVADANAAPSVLVLVRGPNPPPRRADLLLLL